MQSTGLGDERQRFAGAILGHQLGKINGHRLRSLAPASRPERLDADGWKDLRAGDRSPRLARLGPLRRSKPMSEARRRHDATACGSDQDLETPRAITRGRRSID
jgi:hypothetical protein